MLKLASNGGAVINTDDFYIYKKSNGLDELIFNLSIYDDNYSNIVEESVIEYEQPYLVKAIDGGGSTAKIKCQLNLDELKATLNPTYTNGSATLQNTITNVLPEGWVLLDESGISIRRTIEGGYTPYDVIMQCPKTYGCVIRFDVKLKQVKTYDPTNFQPLGSFVSRDLNLKEINYKGKSTDFYTRLYAYGKNGLSFASINNGLPYVDCNTYTDKIICAYWQDERYEVAENLLAAAQETVNAAGVPQRSYECTVYDLAKTNPEMYGFQDFKMFSVVKLIDDVKNVSLNYQVVEYWDYPYYPEKNIVTLSSATPKIQNTVQNINKEINNTNSNFWGGIHNAINAATDMITGVDGGYVVINTNENGQPFEILVMDTPEISTATNVWRWNQNGFGYSPNGYNGPYETAITMDGQIVAKFITAGVLMDGTGRSYWNMQTGEMQLTGNFQQYAQTGLKSVDIIDNQVKFYAWNDNGNYVGSVGAIKRNSDGRVGIETWCDAGDLLLFGYATQEGSDQDITTVFSFDSTQPNATPFIINTANGTIFPDNSGGGIVVENGLIKSWSINYGNGTIFPNNPNGGIKVGNGIIESWNLYGWGGTVTLSGTTLTFKDGLLVGVS